MQHVQDRILGLGALIAGRGVDRHAAVEALGIAVVPDLGHGPVRDAVDGVEVAARTLLRDQQHAGQGGDVAVHEDIVRIDLLRAVHVESISIHLRLHGEGGGVLPHAIVLAQLRDAGGVVADLLSVHLELEMLDGQEIAGQGHAHGLAVLIAEGHGAVRIDDGRLDARAAEQGLLGKGRHSDQERGKNGQLLLHIR